MEIDLRTAFVGSDRHRSVQGVLVAVVVSALILVVSFSPLAAGAIVEPGLVLLGFLLASWWAYDNSGLAISVTLMLAPVVARLAYYWWLHVDQPAPVALPLSFSGLGAWEMWVPLALVLGVIAFGTGVILRRGREFAAGQSSTVA
jgi:hypothetical protein